MRRRYLAAVAGLAVAVALVAGCGGSSGGSVPSDTLVPPASTPHPTSTAPTTPSTPTSTPPTSGTSGPSTSPSSSTGSDPSWNKIPNGRPSEWVPAGVPTTGVYAVSGDEVPKFKLSMFRHDQAGAVAAANYWQISQNWILATNSSVAADAICADKTCHDSAGYMNRTAASHQHINGYRVSFASGGLKIVATNPGAKGELAIELVASYAAGNQVTSTGTVVKRFPAVVKPIRLYMRWNGSRWVVGGQYLAN